MKQTNLSGFSTESLIAELYQRGVEIKDIFMQYYATEEMASARDDEIFGSDEAGQHGKKAEDAKLAGVDEELPKADF